MQHQGMQLLKKQQFIETWGTSPPSLSLSTPTMEDNKQGTPNDLLVIPLLTVNKSTLGI